MRKFLVILAACVLHNFILVNEKFEHDIELQGIDNEMDDNVHEGENAQQPVNIRARDKRNELANLLA